MTAPLNPAQIKRAGQLIEELERIEGELQAIFAGGAGGAKSGRNTDGQSASAAPKKRTMSAAARARIAAAQTGALGEGARKWNGASRKGEKETHDESGSAREDRGSTEEALAKQRRGK
jgi:hypothetical protein